MRAIAFLVLLLVGAVVALTYGLVGTGTVPPPPSQALGEQPAMAQPVAAAFTAGTEVPAPDAGREEGRTDVTSAATCPEYDWQTLQRSETDAIPGIVLRPQQVRIESLLRSVSFNPRDAVIARDDCRRIAEILMRHQSHVRRLADAVAATEEQELQELHAAAKTTSIELHGPDVQRKLTQLGPDPVFRAPKGADTAYAASRSQMPATLAAEARLREAGQAMGQELAHGFLAAGVLTATEVQEVVAALARGRTIRRPRAP